MHARFLFFYKEKTVCKDCKIFNFNYKIGGNDGTYA